MSFYVLLPSNASMDIYPDNKQSSYTTLLTDPIILNTNYEVAVVEFSYSSQFKLPYFIKIDVPNTEFTFPWSAPRVKFEFDISSYNRITAPTKLTTNFIQALYTAAIENEKKLFNQYIKNNSVEPDLYNFIMDLVYAPDSKSRALPQLTEKMRVTLNFENNTLTVKNTLTNTELIFDSSNKPTSIYAYIYTDFIEDQYMGTGLKPCIKSIILNQAKDDIFVSAYEYPHYVKVNKNNINSIKIDIKDGNDNLIKFSNIYTQVIVKLHFRPIENE